MQQPWFCSGFSCTLMHFSNFQHMQTSLGKLSLVIMTIKDRTIDYIIIASFRGCFGAAEYSSFKRSEYYELLSHHYSSWNVLSHWSRTLCHQGTSPLLQRRCTLAPPLLTEPVVLCVLPSFSTILACPVPLLLLPFSVLQKTHIYLVTDLSCQSCRIYERTSNSL